MSDAQRLDWLERNPDRLLVHSRAEGYKFSVLLELGRQLPQTEFNAGKLPKFTDPKYSEQYDTIRDALDEGMKQVL